MRPEIELAETVSALRKILATSTSEGRTFDAVVAGHDPPGTDALDIIDAVAEEGGERPGPTPPVIVFSPRLDEEVLVDLLREGAVDVLSWERPRRLPPRSAARFGRPATALAAARPRPRCAAPRRGCAPS
jgi:CheY-like chemotaxis protein